MTSSSYCADQAHTLKVNLMSQACGLLLASDVHYEMSARVLPYGQKYSKQKKLSKEIYKWYLDNLENVLPCKLSESVACEESMAVNKSVIEHRSASKSAHEIRVILKEIREILSNKASSQSFIPNEKVDKEEGYCENFIR